MSESARDAILRAAIQVFGERGYHATSVRDVVERAGVTKAALYYHFTDKEALWAEAVDGAAARFEAHLLREVRDEELQAFIARYFQACLDWAESDPESLRLIIRAAAEPATLVRWKPERFATFWGSFLERMGDRPPLLGLLVRGAVKELILAVQDGEPLPDDVSERLAALLCALPGD